MVLWLALVNENGKSDIVEGLEIPDSFCLCPLDMQRSPQDKEGGITWKRKKKAMWRNTSVPSEQPMPAVRHVSDTNLDLSAWLPLWLNAATWMSPGKTRRGTLQSTHRIMRKNKSLSSSMTGFGVVYHMAIGNWNRCFYINCSQSLFEGCSEGH